MFKNASLLFFYTLTPLHPGSGASVGTVDLPIQRERHTNFPMIQASGIKGALRDLAEALKEANKLGNKGEAQEKIKWVFGPETERASEHGGALALTDARILLFPVRSAKGVFAWITSPGVIARFLCDLEVASAVNGQRLEVGALQGAAELSLTDNECAVPALEGLVLLGPANAKRVVLEDFCFNVKEDAYSAVKNLVLWLSEKALPSAIGDYWRKKVGTNLVVLNDDRFSAFTKMATEVITRIKLGETGTVEQGPWDEEHLPCETLLYTLVLATDPRFPKEQQKVAQIKNASEVIGFVKECVEKAKLIQFGGDETVGKGLVSMSFFSGGDGHAG